MKGLCYKGCAWIKNYSTWDLHLQRHECCNTTLSPHKWTHCGTWVVFQVYSVYYLEFHCNVCCTSLCVYLAGDLKHLQSLFVDCKCQQSNLSPLIYIPSCLLSIKNKTFHSSNQFLLVPVLDQMVTETWVIVHIFVWGFFSFVQDPGTLLLASAHRW